jgi:hypothetical protein
MITMYNDGVIALPEIILITFCKIICKESYI